MQADRHAAVIARDPRDSKALFAQSSRRVDFSRSWLERSSASMDFAGAGRALPGPGVRPVFARWLIEDRRALHLSFTPVVAALLRAGTATDALLTMNAAILVGSDYCWCRRGT